MVLDKEDYLADARTQLKEKDCIPRAEWNHLGLLAKIIKNVLRKVRNRKDISD